MFEKMADLIDQIIPGFWFCCPFLLRFCGWSVLRVLFVYSVGSRKVACGVMRMYRVACVCSVYVLKDDADTSL